MKIGILTQPLHANYGGLLQNYALQQVLIRAGHDVETIDWATPNNFRVRISRLKARLVNLFYMRSNVQVYRLSQEEKEYIQKYTNYFISKYIKRTPLMTSYRSFKKQIEKVNYDALIVGSDQCWRPCYNFFLYEMFMNFLKGKKIKRISYAASFGSDNWEFTPQQTETCAQLVKNFDLVTIREDSGVRLCKEFFGIDAIHVLDPTMLLTKEDYINLIEKENEPTSSGTLFNYILDPDIKKTKYIQKVANSIGLTVFQVLPKCQAENRTKEDVKKRIEDCVFPKVTEWLRAFMDAEMTIVDSFHGMVFSIIFNKPFWVIGNESRGMSRFTSLLKIFHLEDRLLDTEKNDYVDFLKPIDWISVNSLWEAKRDECRSLLLNKLSE